MARGPVETAVAAGRRIRRGEWRYAASALILAALASSAVTATPALAKDPPKSHVPVPTDPNIANWVTPGLRSWEGRPGTFTLPQRPRIVVAPHAAADVRDVAKGLAHDLRALTGRAPALGSSASDGAIVLQIGSTGTASASPEAYTIEIGSRVTIRSASGAGLFYGAQSVLQLLKRAPGNQHLPHGRAVDWPDYGMRTMMVDIGRKYFEMSALDDLMRQMAWLKMNTLHLHFTDWPAFRLKSAKYPGLAAEQSYDRADIAHLEETARRNHITIIPEIDLPAHASAMIGYRPSLAFKCESLRQSEWLNRAAGDRAKDLAWVIDITREDNRQWIDSLLGEFIPWFSGPYFHIGGDEYNYDADKTRCPELMDYVRRRGLTYPGDAFVEWINATNQVVRAHGKTTVIWNWWRFKDDKTSIEPSKDIVIETWNSPRIDSILASGYKVILSPEDQLYVVPGIENFDGSNYGVVDTTHVYDTMQLKKGPAVLGYALALWTDAAEHRTDTYLLGRSYEPMAVLAERLWSDRSSTSLDAFLARLNRTGGAPLNRGE